MLDNNIIFEGNKVWKIWYCQKRRVTNAKQLKDTQKPQIGDNFLVVWEIIRNWHTIYKCIWINIKVILGSN